MGNSYFYRTNSSATKNDKRVRALSVNMHVRADWLHVRNAIIARGWLHWITRRFFSKRHKTFELMLLFISMYIHASSIERQSSILATKIASTGKSLKQWSIGLRCGCRCIGGWRRFGSLISCLSTSFFPFSLCWYRSLYSLLPIGEIKVNNLLEILLLPNSPFHIWHYIGPAGSFEGECFIPPTHL
jgi:hypothetical protein